MKQTIAGLLADYYAPEAAKYKSALVLVPGLWTGSWCWHTWSTHFCNLGWDCFAINLRGRFGPTWLEDIERLSFDDCVKDLAEVLQTFTFPPVVLGLNLGAHVALKASEKNRVAALVLVSPAPLPDVATVRPRARRLLRLKYLPLVYLRKPFRIREKDFTDYFLTALAKSLQTKIFQGTVPESSLLVKEFFSPTDGIDRASLAFPVLALGGGQDPITPVAETRIIAQWLGGDFNEYPGQGHWLIEQDGESIVRDIHRWVIQKLGDKILLADIM